MKEDIAELNGAIDGMVKWREEVEKIARDVLPLRREVFAKLKDKIYEEDDEDE